MVELELAEISLLYLYKKKTNIEQKKKKQPICDYLFSFEF
jgi:hypothetical protein